MAEDLTLGEVARNLDRLDKAQRQLATDTVPAKQYELAHQALVDRIERHERDARDIQKRMERDIENRFTAVGKEIAAVVKSVEDHEESHENRASWSRSKTLTVITTILLAAATIVGAWIAAVIAAKGVH